MTRFYVLDSFRGLCALFVVAYHMHIVGSFTEFSFFRNSAVFVDFFFILSGFVITHTTSIKKIFIFKDFIISRSFRLLPLHFAMLGVFLVLELGKMLAYSYGIQFNSHPFTGANNVSEIIPNILLIHSWSSSFNSLSFNFPSWSISVEYFVYIIFALFMFFPGKLKKILWLTISVIMFFGLYAKSELITTTAMNGLSCFFTGSLTYLVYCRLQGVINLNQFYATIIETVIIIAACVVVLYDFQFKPIILAAAFGLLILVFSFEQGLLSSLLKKNIFIYIGKLSYSIYMIHAAILLITISIFIILQKLFGIELAPMIDETRHLSFGNSIFNNLLAGSIISTIIFVSHFTYKYIEMTGQRLGKKILGKKRPNSL